MEQLKAQIEDAFAKSAIMVLTPLILTQPEEDVPTAAASEQNGLEGGWEGVEAMDMVR